LEIRSAKMICVNVEIREVSFAGALAHREWVAAPSIERALTLAGGGEPGCEVRLVFA
jgi:hypothetical protein